MELQNQQLFQFPPPSFTICVTGAAGMVSYALIPLLCSGQVFEHYHLHLRLLDIPKCQNVLKAIKMEIEDCNYDLVESIEYGTDGKLLFKNCDIVVFLGAFGSEYSEGLDRIEFLKMNAQIFRQQGQDLELAKPDCKILVIANPASTNCMVLQRNCKTIPRENFTCLTYLDNTRAFSVLANKVGTRPKNIQNVAMWGNRCSSIYPDVNHGNISGMPIRQYVDDQEWLSNTFINKVQTRSAEIRQLRGGGQCMFSAANAAKNHLHD